MKRLFLFGLLLVAMSNPIVAQADEPLPLSEPRSTPAATGDTLAAFPSGKVTFNELVGRVGNLASDSATVIFFMPQDIGSIDPQLKAAAKDLTASYRRRFKRPVTLIMVSLAADPKNTNPVVIWPDYAFGYQRGDKESKALLTSKILWAEPHGYDTGFIVFPASKFRGDEKFYLMFP